MKVLVFGPSGSGKTYVSNKLKQLGISAFDDSEIEGLSNWYDSNGNIVPNPTSAAEALDNNYVFLWSKKAMRKFLANFSTVYVFGGSGNVSKVFDLFDKIYFLKIDEELQKERLRNPLRPTPSMDINEGDMIIWGKWFEKMAEEKGVPFIDASQTPEQIFQTISS
jgi:shikimate kinase